MYTYIELESHSHLLQQQEQQESLLHNNHYYANNNTNISTTTTTMNTTNLVEYRDTIIVTRTLPSLFYFISYSILLCFYIHILDIAQYGTRGTTTAATTTAATSTTTAATTRTGTTSNSTGIMNTTPTHKSSTFHNTTPMTNTTDATNNTTTTAFKNPNYTRTATYIQTKVIFYSCILYGMIIFIHDVIPIINMTLFEILIWSFMSVYSCVLLACMIYYTVRLMIVLKDSEEDDDDDDDGEEGREHDDDDDDDEEHVVVLGERRNEPTIRTSHTHKKKKRRKFGLGMKLLTMSMVCIMTFFGQLMINSAQLLYSCGIIFVDGDDELSSSSSSSPLSFKVPLWIASLLKNDNFNSNVLVYIFLEWIPVMIILLLMHKRKNTSIGGDNTGGNNSSVGISGNHHHHQQHHHNNNSLHHPLDMSNRSIGRILASIGGIRHVFSGSARNPMDNTMSSSGTTKSSKSWSKQHQHEGMIITTMESGGGIHNAYGSTHAGVTGGGGAGGTSFGMNSFVPSIDQTQQVQGISSSSSGVQVNGGFVRSFSANGGAPAPLSKRSKSGGSGGIKRTGSGGPSTGFRSSNVSGGGRGSETNSLLGQRKSMSATAAVAATKLSYGATKNQTKE
jgi:hypothetical protein